MSLAVSLLISSRNGAARLPGVLDGLSGAESPPGGFEIIVVDNASTDRTAEVLHSYATRLPLTVLVETTPGKNVALNRALDIASGELLVFTDDDVRLPTNFLSGYDQVSRRRPDCDLFGGRIVPEWPRDPDPRILLEVPLATAYALTEADRGEGSVEPNRLYGPNMAVRRAVFDSGIRFDESIGPNGGRYLMGDETDLLIRAAAAGFDAHFAPEIKVVHRIREEQLHDRWIARRAFIAGGSMVHNQLRRNNGRFPATPRLAGIPRWAALRLAAAESSVLLRKAVNSRPGWHRALWERGFLRGYVDEYRRQSRAGARR